MRGWGKYWWVVVLLLGLGWWGWWMTTPPLVEAEVYPAGVILRDRQGHVLRVGLGADDQDCRPFYQAHTNDWIVHAVIAAEDQRFWQHAGVDWWALGRAGVQNLRSRRRVSGASTLTMQVLRLIKPGYKRTYARKAIEVGQALRLERRLTKSEILAQYLNRAPFGSNLVGIEAAAQGWFGKTPRELHLGEAALLAGMVQSPTRLRPDRYEARALQRRAYVLQRMQQLGMIDAKQRSDAERIALSLQRAPRPFHEPFFCDWAQRGLMGGDYRTGLDGDLQAVVRACGDRVAFLQGCDVAVVILELPGGEVRSWYCSGDYFDPQGGQVNTVLTVRPAGSTLKPFAYALALERGLVTPAFKLADVPRTFGEVKPVNFSGKFVGPVTAREALIGSLNIPAIELVELCGLERFHDVLLQLGLSSLRHPSTYYGLGLALGNGSVCLLDLARAYACLGREGVTLPARDGTAARLFSAGTAWLVADALGGDERSLAALGHVGAGEIARFAWKTGTSAGFRDAWTVAWNPGWVVAVWCGHKSGRSGDESLVGPRVAAPLAWEIARHLPEAGWFQRPATVVTRELCAVSGCTPGVWCQQRVSDWVLDDRTLSQLCPVHVADGAGGVREQWPVEVVAWRNQVQGAAAEEHIALRITTPREGEHFQLLAGVEQEVLFRVNTTAGKGELIWFCNDAVVARGAQFRWRPVEGRHRFVCVAGNGEHDTVSVKVSGEWKF